MNRKSTDGVTATQLSADMGIKTPSINVVLSKLERKGLICRITDPDDRRFVLITLSEEGEAKVTQFIKNALRTGFRGSFPISALKKAICLRN